MKNITKHIKKLNILIIAITLFSCSEDFLSPAPTSVLNAATFFETEADLEAALETKSISGAGLDVTFKEPLSQNSKLLSFDNVILTPHALCWTDECFHDIASEAISSIIKFIDHKPIINQINK